MKPALNKKDATVTLLALAMLVSFAPSASAWPVLQDVYVCYRLPADWSEAAPYPYDNTSIKIKAVAIAEFDGQTRAYTDELQQSNDGKWYMVGTDGPYSPNPTSRFTTFPTLSQATYPTIYQWPSQYGSPTFSWQKRKHRCYYYCDTEAPYDRKYDYQMAGTPAWGWGYSGTPPDGRGVMRYRVSAGYEGVTKSSQDEEYATRLGVRDSSSFGLTEEDENYSHRKKYLQWLYAYWGGSNYGVPYEWGGVWFGGKASDTCVGGEGDYQGYGIDCSAYVSACAKWATYGWTGGTWGWYYNTTELLDVSKSITQDELGPGDILLKPGTHVYTVVWKYESDVMVIAAKGEDPGKGPGAPDLSRVMERTFPLSDLIDDGFQPRRLVVIPEPAVLSLLALGGLTVLQRRRR